VFGKDNQDKVPMEKVIMLIWQFRDDPSVVQFMARFVAKYASHRGVFDGIEFYLPQLAHMIIHLEASWDDAILERFALVISQHSLHFALQFNWILQGAIEDYQPEAPNGEPNPSYNPLYYSRCIKLLGNIERCVVYGTPRVHDLQRLFEEGKISLKEYELLGEADRRFIAEQIASNTKDKGGSEQSAAAALISGGYVYGGDLLYKRHVRTGRFKKKQWKTRYFAVADRMLYCYNVSPADNAASRIVRSMPLEGAIIQDTEKPKYPHMFEVHNMDFLFRMRAANEEEKGKWMGVLKQESKANPVYPQSIGQDVDAGKNDKVGKVLAEHQGVKETVKSGQEAFSSSAVIQALSPSQRSRYEFYKQERDFVRALTGVAEMLRFKERDMRKKLAPGLMQKLEFPDCVYVPMCNSTDIWRRAHSTFYKETRVFNTKERCPTVMYFLTKRGEQLHHHRGGMKDVNLDVAEFLHLQYEVPDPPSGGGALAAAATKKKLKKKKKDFSMSNITEGEEEYEIADDEDEDDDDDDEEEGLDVGLWKETKEEDKVGKSSSDKAGTTRGNRQLKQFIRESVTQLPHKISQRIELRKNQSLAPKAFRDNLKKASSHQTSMSYLDHIPIVENRSEDESDAMSLDGHSVVSAGPGSVLLADGIVLTHDDHEKIDRESLNRAKAIVSGGETYSEQTARMLKEASTSTKNASDLDKDAATCEVLCVIAKSNDDLRQEVFIMQMIHFYKSVFAAASLPIWLKTYRILSTSKDTGLIEVLTDSTSIDGLKKSKGYPSTGGMRAYFEKVYGKPSSRSFQAAQRNFMLSLVGYSLVSYLLGLKDRHNGNIMIDTRGYLIHIDFGFAFGMAPGHEFSIERAPFKLTRDYMDVMDGEKSECFTEFKRLFVAGFEAARASSQVALGLVEIMMYKSNYPCFTGSRYGNGIALKRFEERLMLSTPDQKIRKKALNLILHSIEHTGTKAYDKFQHMTNGYAI